MYNAIGNKECLLCVMVLASMTSCLISPHIWKVPNSENEGVCK